MLRVNDGEVTYELRGRVASIIRWLVRNADKINRGSGRIRFAFGGQDLKATIEFDEAID
jgi:flagellar biosynthesis regulator FlaF